MGRNSTTSMRKEGGYNWDIWVSTWDSALNDWGIPQNVGPPVNTPGTEFSAHIGPDGRHLYFSSGVFIPDSLARCGVHVSEWDGTSWSEPVRFPTPDSCNFGEYPSRTADSVWFYLERGVSDGLSSFVIHWNGSFWEPPVDLRPQVGGRSASPFVVPSGDSLFFRSIDLAGFGITDIFLIPRVVLGDLNLDGRLTVADVVLELNAVFLSETFPVPFETADGNCDGGLSPADVVLLLNATFMGTPFLCR